MSTRLILTFVIYGMVQGVLFGLGTAAILVSPLQSEAIYLIPVVIAASLIGAAPIAWKIAPKMRSHYLRRRSEEMSLAHA